MMSETLRLEGELSFSTVNSQKVAFLAAVSNCKTEVLRVSLQGIVKADSAGLALMIEGRRFAAKLSKLVHYVEVPKQLLALASFCQVDFILENENDRK